jgi:hypothetical protein
MYPAGRIPSANVGSLSLAVQKAKYSLKNLLKSAFESVDSVQSPLEFKDP